MNIVNWFYNITVNNKPHPSVSSDSPPPPQTELSPRDEKINALATNAIYQAACENNLISPKPIENEIFSSDMTDYMMRNLDKEKVGTIALKPSLDGQGITTYVVLPLYQSSSPYSYPLLSQWDKKKQICHWEMNPVDHQLYTKGENKKPIRNLNEFLALIRTEYKSQNPSLDIADDQWRIMKLDNRSKIFKSIPLDTFISRVNQVDSEFFQN
jgi:hypothetical protein